MTTYERLILYILILLAFLVGLKTGWDLGKTNISTRELQIQRYERKEL